MRIKEKYYNKFKQIFFQMHYFKLVLLYGFAIFAMFFGSGNLVFPLQIGQTSGASWLAGYSGLLLTGIFLPLMGLFVIKLYQGSYQAFFNEAGKIAGTFLPLLMLALLGSFGVVPRCITVAFGSMSFLFPQVSLTLFSLFFCLITFFLCINDKIMVKILGKWLSPILLLTLIVLIGMAVIKAPAETKYTLSSQAFSNGFFTGYQTMDLFAAFFFSALVFQQIQTEFPHASTKEIILFAIKPSIIGALLLAIVYAGLVYIGAHYSSMIKNVTPELMLPTVAAQALGSQATLLMAITMFFSCLTTAVALNNLFARYLSSRLKFSNRNFAIPLFITTSLSFIISLLDFKGIALFLTPILGLAYPAVIALTALCIILRKQQRIKIVVFYLITMLIGGASSIHLLG